MAGFVGWKRKLHDLYLNVVGGNEIPPAII